MNCTSLINFTNCINKPILYLGCNYVGHITGEILKSLDGQIKICIKPCSYGPSVKIYFLADFEVISNILRFFPSRVSYRDD
jgi:hypothetical protein